MKKKVKARKGNFQSYSLLFFFTSFVGWVFETCVCLFQSGTLCDRGFLLLPFCPVYGAPVCVIYLLFGRPTDGLFYRLLTQKKQKSTGQVWKKEKIISVFLYFVSAMLIATTAELIVGLILEDAGVSLWSYGGLPLCYKGVICLPVSLIWGVLISLFTQFVLPKIEKFFLSLPKVLTTVLSVVLWVAIGVDFVLNWKYSIENGAHFDFVDYFNQGGSK